VLAERAVRTVPVIVVDVLGVQLEVAPSEDKHAVETFSPDGAHEPLGDGVRSRRPDRSLDNPDALSGEDGSKDALNLVSRSRTRNLTAAPCSASSMQMFRACWVTQSVAGLAVTPAIRTGGCRGR